VKKAIAILLALLGCAASGAALAHGGVRFGIGIGFGWPGYWGPGPYWAPAYYYPPPAYYYPPPPAYYYPPPPAAAAPAPTPATPAYVEAGPPLVVPGANKSFDDFRSDDADCRGQSVSDASYQQCMYARGHRIATQPPAQGTRYSAPGAPPPRPVVPPTLPN
jgi:hypothetical protein